MKKVVLAWVYHSHSQRLVVLGSSDQVRGEHVKPASRDKLFPDIMDGWFYTRPWRPTSEYKLYAWGGILPQLQQPAMQRFAVSAHWAPLIYWLLGKPVRRERKTCSRAERGTHLIKMDAARRAQKNKTQCPHLEPGCIKAHYIVNSIYKPALWVCLQHSSS